MDLFQFFLAIFNGLLFTILGWLYMKYPPKEINHIYGYRTRRSMANQHIWDYANAIGSKMIYYIGLVTLFSSTLLYFIFDSGTVVMASIFILLLGLGIGMYKCETLLNKRFDKNGKPKK
ncbi:SdpI family protein [Costertonia aggregata]|uniref:SdpI family protein n=1 Tax=Costertonia aggregata TaxID=343403 RepID=A0A7H9AP12_9FLAO|nr:SdpI family protein [Costertonia aggregata]QLG45134.1 SdpI family protein [Costertonia aggregata]